MVFLNEKSLANYDAWYIFEKYWTERRKLKIFSTLDSQYLSSSTKFHDLTVEIFSEILLLYNNVKIISVRLFKILLLLVNCVALFCSCLYVLFINAISILCLKLSNYIISYKCNKVYNKYWLGIKILLIHITYININLLIFIINFNKFFNII